MKLLCRLFLIVAILATTSGMCFAETYPSKPIKLFVQYGAGGSTDIVSRKLASIAEKELGVPIVVENKPGATGTLAIRELMKLKPDGYTLSMIDTSATSRTPHIVKVPYDAQKDFTYICKVVLYACGIIVPVEKPWNSLEEIVAHAKKNPGEVVYAVPGALEAGYLAMAYVGMKENLKWKRVPYKGGSEAMAAVLGGHADFFAGGSMGSNIKLIQAGKVRAVSIFSPKRFELLPEVPTLHEAGYDFAIRSGLGISAPAGLDPAKQQLLEKVFLKASQDPSFIELVNTMAMPFDRKSGKEFKRDAAIEYDELGQLLSDMGMKKN